MIKIEGVGGDRLKVTSDDVVDSKGTASEFVIRGTYGLRAWFSSYAWVRNKGGKWEDAELNILQERVCDAVEYCLENNLPVRIIILKPRQKGASTISVATIYWAMKAFGIHGICVGGQYSEVKNMWKILERYSEKDKFNWGVRDRINQDGAVFSNGAILEKETARDKNAGRSGTYQGMLATEAARWNEGEAAPPSVVINGILNCMPDAPGTFGIIDSTAEGASGFYYQKWEKAVWLHERKNGRVGNGWIKVFAGWHEFKDSRKELVDVCPSEFEESLDDKERALRREYDLDLEQLYWRRHTIADNCDGDERLFDMDFPGKPADAFAASRPSKFHSGGLSMIREVALNHAKPIYANLSQPGGATSKDIVLEPQNKESDFHEVVIFDTPRIGQRYNMAVDTMTGEHCEGDKPDNHAATVWREGFWDERGHWLPTKLVARSTSPCVWDIDVLEDVVFRLSAYYGMCQIVPEENQDRGLIRALVARGANVYIRNVSDEATTERYVVSKERFGFKTKAGGENARKVIIDNFAKMVREQFKMIDGGGIEIPDLKMIDEMETFVVNLKGKPEAAAGAKDDLVMSGAIALATMGGATKFVSKKQGSNLPPDIQQLMKGRRSRSRKAQYA